MEHRFTLMSKFANTSKWAGLTPYILYSHILQHLSINRTEKRTKFKRFHVARFPKFFSIKSKAGNLFTWATSPPRMCNNCRWGVEVNIYGTTAWRICQSWLWLVSPLLLLSLSKGFKNQEESSLISFTASKLQCCRRSWVVSCTHSSLCPSSTLIRYSTVLYSIVHYSTQSPGQDQDTQEEEDVQHLLRAGEGASCHR